MCGLVLVLCDSHTASCTCDNPCAYTLFFLLISLCHTVLLCLECLSFPFRFLPTLDWQYLSSCTVHSSFEPAVPFLQISLWVCMQKYSKACVQGYSLQCCDGRTCKQPKCWSEGAVSSWHSHRMESWAGRRMTQTLICGYRESLRFVKSKEG